MWEISKDHIYLCTGPEVQPHQDSYFDVLNASKETKLDMYY